MAGPPTLDELVARLDQEVRRISDRLRRLPQRAWREPSHAPAWTGAQAIAHLAVAWATLGQCAEHPDGTAIRPVPMPAYPTALADVVAVVGNDLVLSLRALPAGAAVHSPGGERTAEQVAAVALAEALVHGWDMLNGTVDDGAAELVLAVLEPDRRAIGGAGLLELRGRVGARAGQQDWAWEPVEDAGIG